MLVMETKSPEVRSVQSIPQFVVTPRIREMVKAKLMRGASDIDIDYNLEIAQQRNLNPLLNQIYFVSRKDRDNSVSWTSQVSIEGLRAIAQRTGLYAGYGKPEFRYDGNDKLILAEIHIHRRDWPSPAYGFAYWEEYVQRVRNYKTGQEEVAKFWSRMPHVMLAKVAESVALRHAFPEAMSGLYIPEEMRNEEDEDHKIFASAQIEKPSSPVQQLSSGIVDADDVPDTEDKETPEIVAAMEDLRGVSDTDLGSAAAVWNKHESRIYGSVHGDIQKITDAMLEFLSHFKRTVSTNRFRRYTEAEALSLKDPAFSTLYGEVVKKTCVDDLASFKMSNGRHIEALDERARHVLGTIFADKVNEFFPDEKRPNTLLARHVQKIMGEPTTPDPASSASPPAQ